MSSRTVPFSQRIAAAWQRRGWLACLLLPVALLFGALSALRRLAFRRGWLASSRLPVPVVVVGNVFVGGTGKTPLVLWLVAALRDAGYVPGVISRGYGGQHGLAREVCGDSLAQQVGDEPLLIARRGGCPVFVGHDRVAAGRALLAVHPAVNVLVSDDGLQHYRLQRALEIVLFDERGVGNGWLLPAGPLREPMSRRRDFTVVNGGNIPAGFPADTMRMTLAGGYAEALAVRTRSVPLASLTGRILAAAGIGNPERFFRMLRDHGLTIDTLALPDHHDFSGNPFAGVDAEVILITEKDAVKCVQIEALKTDPRLWVVPVAACLDGPLAELIVEKLRGYPTA
ncbi:tetraacyldisaccharide 4'-kinase [Actimicrobium sp. CCC2.4]|uniref:tetraacyldisaccharide 4'-kinase n=1 Tax=Actimicrobium sp. CCC2.4 TaxID=3048606 RepID=UPI002AC89D8B|nr:tetraacyldisaccharide 4'-kinase [Actimicrobium sp. CCC2.4]MEB0134960.1 tetraacyldisaccharide 4'-kinase [Actimicrobium sp. CCC2.4]WPX31990.1 tetraacyldisaccharide 4'-kinase [Actimicrobium sp. CCC2.4]